MMKSFALTVCNVIALAASARAAQDADRIAPDADRVGNFRAVKTVGVDGNDADRVWYGPLTDAARMRPIVIVKDTTAVLRARPDATYAIVAGLRQPPNDADRVPMIKPVLVLRCGQVGADGRAEIALPASDFAKLKAADVLLQAVVLSHGDKIEVSEPLALRRRFDGDVTSKFKLKLDNLLPEQFAVSAGISSTDSIPAFYMLHLTVVAPTTGYRLRYVSTVMEADHTAVIFELIDADSNLRHLPVLDTLNASTSLGDGGNGPIMLTVRRAQKAADKDADKVEARKPIN